MKSMASSATPINGQTIKSWLVGTVCGIALATSLVAGTGHLQLKHHVAAQPSTSVQQPAITSEVGDVPPPIDELRVIRGNPSVPMPVLTAQESLVPPPIEEFRSNGVWRVSLADPMNNDAPPMPLNIGSTKY